MSFVIKATEFFISQIEALPHEARALIEEKIDMIKENPFRFKKIQSKQFSKVFRVRLNIENRDSRMVYVVVEPNVIIVALLSRKDDYRDLEKHLRKLR